LANCETIDVVKYTQKNIDSNNGEEAFRHLESISLSEPRGNIVSAGVAYFGTVIEYDTALMVLCSDDELVTLSGSVARWRVYPRSFRYENHLHAVYENRLVIYSFVNDYFVDQRMKTRGIEYREDPDLGTGATAEFDYA
jgi:shikimate kinase